MASIRNRIAIYILIGMAVLLVAAGVVIDHLLRAQLLQEFDRNLLSKAMTLVTLTELDDGEIEFDYSDEFMLEFSRRDQPEYFLLWRPDDAELGRSPSMRGAELPRLDSELDEPSYSDLVLGDGRSVRMVAFNFVPRSDEEDDVADPPEETDGPVESAAATEEESAPPTERSKVGIAVARGREDLDQLLADIRTTLTVTLLVLMAAVAMLVHYALRQGLGPLRRITEEVGRLDATRLHTRLDSPVDSEELLPIVNQLNRLLGRLDDAFQREQRFSGNVAHELRTPIAELRTMAEVGEKWPDDEKMVRAFFNDLVGLAGDMEKTVTNLLTIARLETGRQMVESESIHLRDLADHTWKHVAASAEGREVQFDNRVHGDLEVRTDKGKLTLILNNLLTNAVIYSPPGATVIVDAGVDETGIEISLTNPVVDLDRDDLPMMFERFWRKDKARTGGHHVGLGLSVIRALAEVLELVVTPRLDADGRFTMTVSGLRPA